MSHTERERQLRLALHDLASEFVQIRTEFERLKRTYEPPYVAYASWALPAALSALGAEVDA